MRADASANNIDGGLCVREIQSNVKIANTPAGAPFDRIRLFLARLLRIFKGRRFLELSK